MRKCPYCGKETLKLSFFHKIACCKQCFEYIKNEILCSDIFTKNSLGVKK